MKILTIKTGPVAVNTYIVFNEKTTDGFIIDPGGNFDKIKKAVEDNKITLKAQLLTHGHFDHCGACTNLQREGIPVYIHKDDANKLCTSGNLAAFLGFKRFENFTADYTFNDKDVLNIAGLNVEILHTPGHSTGSSCFIIENSIFSGDTLFNMSMGRTDFPDGDEVKLANSLKKLFALVGDFNVYPGHEEYTTLDYERKYNPMAEN